MVVTAFKVWMERRGTRRLPAREDIPPRAMAPFLRNLVLVRVLDGGRDYEFRVVGDAIVQVQGKSFQGLALTEIDRQLPGYGGLLRPIYDKVRARCEPLAFRGTIHNSPAERSFSHESLVLPLGPEDGVVDHILVVGAYAYTMGETPPP
jgi:hypothetical protein